MTEQHPDGHVRAVLIPVDPAEPVVVEVLDATPAGRWATVGGAQPEGMALDDHGTTLFLDGHGKAKRLPRNDRATALVNAMLPGFARADFVAGHAWSSAPARSTATRRRWATTAFGSCRPPDPRRALAPVSAAAAANLRTSSDRQEVPGSRRAPGRVGSKAGRTTTVPASTPRAPTAAVRASSPDSGSTPSPTSTAALPDRSTDAAQPCAPR